MGFVAIGAGLALAAYDDQQRKMQHAAQDQKRAIEEQTRSNEQMFMERRQAENDARAKALQAGGTARRTVGAGTGRSDTLATGPKGLGEVPAQNLQTKTLLGY